MKNRNIQTVLATVALAGALAACSSSKAPDTASVSVPLALPAESTAAPASDASQGTVAAGPATPIPAATDDIWKALDKQSADLQTAIQNGAWKDVPGKADAIRDLAAALPGHASKLSTDAQAKLQQDVTLVGKLVEKLDAAGTSGDAAAAKLNYKKLNDALGGITRFP